MHKLHSDKQFPRLDTAFGWMGIYVDSGNFPKGSKEIVKMLFIILPLQKK